MAGRQRILSFTGGDDGSLVIDRLCDEAVEEGTAISCFYFEFAA